MQPEPLCSTKDRSGNGQFSDCCGEDLPDCAEVIGSMGNAAKCTGGGDVVPVVPHRHGPAPFSRFVLQSVAKGAPLLVCHHAALPVCVPIGAGPGVFLTGNPSVKQVQSIAGVI